MPVPRGEFDCPIRRQARAFERSAEHRLEAPPPRVAVGQVRVRFLVAVPRKPVVEVAAYRFDARAVTWFLKIEDLEETVAPRVPFLVLNGDAAKAQRIVEIPE